MFNDVLEFFDHTVCNEGQRADREQKLEESHERRKRADYWELKVMPQLNGFIGENKWQSRS